MKIKRLLSVIVVALALLMGFTVVGCGEKNVDAVTEIKAAGMAYYQTHVADYETFGDLTVTAELTEEQEIEIELEYKEKAEDEQTVKKIHKNVVTDKDTQTVTVKRINGELFAKIEEYSVRTELAYYVDDDLTLKEEKTFYEEKETYCIGIDNGVYYITYDESARHSEDEEAVTNKYKQILEDKEAYVEEIEFLLSEINSAVNASFFSYGTNIEMQIFLPITKATKKDGVTTIVSEGNLSQVGDFQVEEQTYEVNTSLGKSGPVSVEYFIGGEQLDVREGINVVIQDNYKRNVIYSAELTAPEAPLEGRDEDSLSHTYSIQEVELGGN